MLVLCFKNIVKLAEKRIKFSWVKIYTDKYSKITLLPDL